MSLPQEEWLHLAKRLAVGQTQRFYHGRERRPNMVIKNLSDKYVVYCNACKVGGVVEKEHVRITNVAAPSMSADLSLPHDMERVLTSEKAVQDAVLGFLAHKNMDAQYLPELWFSKSRCRVLLQCNGEWLGRDTTERSPQKWLTYNGSTYISCADTTTPRGVAIVTEDTFSMYKVAWALSGYGQHVFSSLGTRLSNELMVELLQYERVLMFYDGDPAGFKGALKEAHRLRSCGVPAYADCAPEGLDPKDMTIDAIRHM